MSGLLRMALGSTPVVVAALARRLGGAGAGRLWRRLLGGAFVVGFVAMMVAQWHPVYRFTTLLQCGQDAMARAVPALRTQPVAVHEGGYDGQYYVQLACDPSLRAPELPTAVDTLSYRARRILLPAVAWGLGGGDAERAVQIYPWLNIVCWFAVAALLWPLLQADHRWLGVAAWSGVLFSAGVLASVRYSLTDLPALLLLVLALRAAAAGRSSRMAGWFAASLLTRETMLVNAWGLLPKAWDSWRALWRAGLLLALAVLPLLLWLLYIQWQIGASGPGVRNFAWPGAGWWGEWLEEVGFAASWEYPWLGIASLLATVGLTVQAVFVLSDWRPAERWWRVGAGSVVLMLFLGPAVWEGVAGASLRVLLPLLLASNVMALQRKRAWLWLLLINLSVPAGLSDMVPMPREQELAAVRAGDTAAVLNVGDGCYGQERLRKEHWVWTQSDAQLRLQLWTSETAGAEVTLTARVRALDERELVISWAGGELWRGRVGRNWSQVRLVPLAVATGEVTLLLHSEAPAVREGSGLDVRQLSVCVLNPSIELRARPGRSVDR